MNFKACQGRDQAFPEPRRSGTAAFSAIELKPKAGVRRSLLLNDIDALLRVAFGHARHQETRGAEARSLRGTGSESISYAEQTLYCGRHFAFPSVLNAFAFFSPSPFRGFFIILPTADFSNHASFLYFFLEHAKGKFDVVIIHSNYH